MNAFLTVKEIASVLKINALTVYAYIRAGKLPAFRIGHSYRIEEKDFSEFIHDHRIPTPEQTKL